ncbi:hypothetical protein BsWGS_03767 [Bradybaena similaris]
MEAIIVKQNVLCPQSPPSKVALTLDGQRSELLLPFVSKLTNENSHHYGESLDEDFEMFEKKEDQRLTTAKKSIIIEDNVADQKCLHSSQGYNSENSITAKQQGQSNDDVVPKGSDNLTPNFMYISPGSSRKSTCSSGFHDKISDDKRSNTLNSRIHKSPVARQDSVAFDIKLGNPNETLHKIDTETKRRVGNEQMEELHNTYNKNTSGVHYALQEESPYTSDGQGQTKTKQNLPSDANLTPSTESGKMHDKTQFFSKPVADSGWGVAENIIPQVRNHPASEQVKIQCDQKYVKSHPFAKNAYSDEPKSTDSRKQKYSSDKERGTTLNQQVFQYGVLFVMIVLIVMLVHLHTRVAALESSGVSSTTMGCQCEKTIVTQVGHFNDQRLNSNNEIADSNNKEAHEQIMAYFDNEKQKPSPGDDTAKLVIDSEGNRNIPSDKKHPIFKAGQGKNKSINRMQTGKNAVKGNITNATAKVLNRASNDSTDPSSSTDRNITGKDKSMHNFLDSNLQTVDTFPQINKVESVELTDFTTDTAGQQLSRIKRSPKTLITDPSLKNDLQEKRKRKKPKPENGNTGPQVENFEVPFFDRHFPYSTHFTTQDPLSKHKDCTTRHTWGHGIEACKDTRVIFPEKHSVLPFYLPTTTTASKDDKKRMINVDASGKFNVNISGDYLFQLNITILSESENHFLALYLNDQATFACQHGGFVCPHTNDPNSNKYKVCTIIGVLELRKNDILDIRTMAPHMTVRAEVHHLRKSQIKFILLSKIK